MARRRRGRTLPELAVEAEQSLERVRLLMDACDAWLRDPDDPLRYQSGPRAEEVMVTYTERSEEGKPVRRKAPLGRLLAKLEAAGEVSSLHAEINTGDTRVLLLRTAQEIRQSVQALAELGRNLADAARLEAFQKAVLEEVAKADAESAKRIGDRLRPLLLQYADAGGASGTGQRRA